MGHTGSGGALVVHASAIDCVSALRRQHMVSFDCPSAYLQGQQQPSEQVLARPPPGSGPSTSAASRSFG